MEKKLEDELNRSLNTDKIINPVFRNNMKKDKEYFIKRKIRKGIETAFSIITAKFGKVIKAKIYFKSNF
ncbi:hypothetical protein [Lebetimonas sp. JS032]|uniref:hypothetical protein n=1 Tax=Lebetimonas sp. JS032 TaxID=990070 RepID=UPI0004B35593|nr:hypothetical protein [Lebetimonas sp. JS032]